MRARLQGHRRPRRQQLLERFAKSIEPQLRLQQVDAMHVEHGALDERGRAAVHRRRHTPPLQQRQRVLDDVLEAVVEGDDRHRLGQIGGRVHQLAHRRADEVLRERRGAARRTPRA